MAGILDEFLLVFKPTVQGSGFQKLNKQMKQTQQSLFSVKNLFRSFVGYDIYSGLKQFGKGLIDSSKELGAMTSRFYAITKSEKLANEELQWTFDLANRTAMSLKATADSYSIFYAATQKGLGTEGARSVFQDWTEVSRVLHLSEYQFERVTYALREMASKGAIYSQDLRMQIGTHVPNAMGLAEKAVNELGITGGNWFEDFRKEAKGNQKLINQFIVLFSKYAKEMYASPEALAKAMKQPDAQIQTLLNRWKEFQYAIVKGGFEKDLVDVLSNLNIILGSIVKHAPKIYQLVKTLLGFFIFIKSIKFLGAGAKALGTFVGRIAILTAEFGSLKLALGQVGKMFAKTGLLRLLAGVGGTAGLAALFTTPPGWVILGLTAIVAGVMWFKHKFPNAWSSIVDVIDTFITKLSDLIYRIGVHTGVIKPKPTILPTDTPEIKAEKEKQITLRKIEDKQKDVQITGGIRHNSKYIGTEDEIRQMNQALSYFKTVASRSKAGSVRQQIVINVTNKIEGEKDAKTIIKMKEELGGQLLREDIRPIVDVFKNMGKRIFKKNQ